MNKNIPTPISNLAASIFTLTAFGTTSCSHLFDGTAKCWGRNSFGEIGDGTSEKRLAPTAVAGVSGLVDIDAGTSHTCAVESDGEVRCWGSNTNGRLGNGSTTSSTTPVLAHGSARQVGAGGAHTCSVTNEGNVRCWGLGTKGQLGNGGVLSASSPVSVTFDVAAEKVLSVSLGNQHSCALHADGAVSCWGNNNYNQVGGESSFVTTPRTVFGYGPANPAVAVAAGMSHTCVLAADGVVSCWGRNDLGQTADPDLENHGDLRSVSGLDVALVAPQVILGQVGHESVEVEIATSTELGAQMDLEFSADAGFSGVTTYGAGPVGPTSQVDVGERHACAVTVGQVRCWGDNESLQAGTGVLRSDGSRLASHELVDIVSVSSGATASCALDAAGAVACWGENLGGDTLLDSPESVALDEAATTVSVGSDAACVVSASGRVSCWGAGAVVDSATPTTIDLGSGVTARDVAVGHSAACVIAGDATVRCWGTGPVGSADAVSIPVTITYGDGTPIRARFVAVGQGHACAITDAGDAACWGSNNAGQLGRNSTVASAYADSVSLGADTSKWVSLGVGGDMTCGLRGSGSLQCWGGGTDTLMPTDVVVSSGVGAVTTVSVGWTEACAVTLSGDVACWDGGTEITSRKPSSKMVSATIEITGLSPVSDYVVRGVVTRAGRSTLSGQLSIRTAAEPTTTTTSSTTSTTTMSTTTTTTTTTVEPSTSTSSSTTISTGATTSTTTLVPDAMDEETTTTLPSNPSTSFSTTTTMSEPDEVVWPTVTLPTTTVAQTMESSLQQGPEPAVVDQQSILTVPQRLIGPIKRPKTVTLTVRQGHRLTLRELARRVKVWIPESMVVKMLTSSRVESVAAWSDTMARLVVGTTSRCQATLADYVHPAVKANRPGKCLVVVTVRHPSGETVVRNVTLEVKASKVPSRRSLVGNVR